MKIFDAIQESMELQEKLVPVTKEELANFVKICNKHGFEIDDSVGYKSPKENYFGDAFHFQIINKNVKTSEETFRADFDKYCRPLADELDAYGDEINSPVTWNFGANMDLNLTCGFDVREKYIRDEETVEEALTDFLKKDDSDFEVVKDSDSDWYEVRNKRNPKQMGRMFPSKSEAQKYAKSMRGLAFESVDDTTIDEYEISLDGTNTERIFPNDDEEAKQTAIERKAKFVDKHTYGVNSNGDINYSKPIKSETVYSESLSDEDGQEPDGFTPEGYPFFKKSSKSVMDESGFYTDYTLYMVYVEGEGLRFELIFGDNDVYDPSNTYADFETDNPQEAVEWFEDFNGFEDIDEALAPKDNPNIQNGFVTKPYWYFTKHGVQPGSVPKGVEIEEIKDTEHGTYFSTYYLLTTQELKDFDIKEERPQLDESIVQKVAARMSGGEREYVSYMEDSSNPSGGWYNVKKISKEEFDDFNGKYGLGGRPCTEYSKITFMGESTHNRMNEESNINTLGEKTVELRSVNGHRIFRCKDNNGNTYYDVYDKAFEFFESFKTLAEAKKFAMGWIEESLGDFYKRGLVSKKLSDKAKELYRDEIVPLLKQNRVKECTDLLFSGRYTSVQKEVLAGLCEMGYAFVGYEYVPGRAFQESNITKAIIPEGVESINSMAFYECANLKSVELPNTLRTIGSGAFSWCSSLENIEIPEGVETIGRLAFRHCNLKSVKLPNSLRCIEENALTSSENTVFYTPSNFSWENVLEDRWERGWYEKHTATDGMPNGSVNESLNEEVVKYFGLIDKFMNSELVDVTKASSKEEAEKYFGRFSTLDDTLYVKEISERQYNKFNDRASTYNESLKEGAEGRQRKGYKWIIYQDKEPYKIVAVRSTHTEAQAYILKHLDKDLTCDEVEEKYAIKGRNYDQDLFEESLNEDFWNPSQEFTDFIEFEDSIEPEFNEKFGTNGGWNSWSQEQRDEFCDEVVARYLKDNYATPMLLDDLTDNNFHSEWKAFKRWFENHRW